jgi:hypothetical protein
MSEEKVDKKEQNLYLWKQVQDTPKELITEYEVEDGKKLKTVAPINKMKKATEMFGVYGEKWGLKTLVHKEQRIFDTLLVATLDAVFFYEKDNKVIEFEITNSLPIVCLVDKVMKVNHTYRKAIETDTITKALSRLGFNADIYTDGELVGTAQQEGEISEMELVEVGVDLKKEVKDV